MVWSQLSGGSPRVCRGTRQVLAREIMGGLTRGVGALTACSGVLSAVKATRGAAFIVCVVVVPGVYRGSIARSVGVTPCSCACPRSHLTCVAPRWSAVRKAHTQHPDARCLRRVLDAATDPRPVFVSAPHNAGAVPMLLDGCVVPLDVRYEVPCLPSVCCACTVVCCAGLLTCGQVESAACSCCHSHPRHDRYAPRAFRRRGLQVSAGGGGLRVAGLAGTAADCRAHGQVVLDPVQDHTGASLRCH